MAAHGHAMDAFDAVIVGGGPAGSTCAWKLVQAGLHVAVLDRASFPRDKVCAGWITPAVLDLLALDIENYRKDRVFQPITGFRTGVLGYPPTETQYPQPVSFGIRRYEFDHYLLQRCGARLRCAEPVSSVRRTGGRWIVNGGISTPLLIGAGGHFCPVARWLNSDRRPGEVVATLEMEVLLRDQQVAQCSVLPKTPALYFCQDFKGYGWCFRKENFLNVGLGRQDPHQLPRHTHEFLTFLKSHRIVPDDLPVPSRGHAYLLHDDRPRECIGDGVILVGDAAGLADPRSGEGIRPAVESGLLAARTILDADGGYSRENLELYRQRLQVRFAAGGIARHMTAAVPARFIQRMAGRLMENRWFTRRVLLDRWFLGRDHAPLSLTALSRAPSIPSIQ